VAAQRTIDVNNDTASWWRPAAA